MIRKLQKFVRLNTADKELFFQVWLRLWQVRTMLWTSTYNVTRSRLQKKVSIGDPVKSDLKYVKKIARFVSVASGFVPRASCLVQALAGECLLRESGFDPSLHIGVKREHSETFEAHAWLEFDGTKVIGGPASTGFRSICQTHHDGKAVWHSITNT